MSGKVSFFFSFTVIQISSKKKSYGTGHFENDCIHQWRREKEENIQMNFEQSELFKKNHALHDDFPYLWCVLVIVNAKKMKKNDYSGDCYRRRVG